MVALPRERRRSTLCPAEVGGLGTPRLWVRRRSTEHYRFVGGCCAHGIVPELGTSLTHRGRSGVDANGVHSLRISCVESGSSGGLAG